MAYEPTNWKSGDVVTSAKLNKMEQGIAGAGPLKIGYTSYDLEENLGTLDHTWQEIHDAMTSGRLVVASYRTEKITIISIVQGDIIDESGYGVSLEHEFYYASSPDGYPSNEDDPPAPSPVG